MTTFEAARIVAAREIKVRLRDKTFLISTAFFLLIAVASAVLPSVLDGGPTQSTLTYETRGPGEPLIVDVDGAWVIPGFIDPHIHLLGGSGEGGFAKQTPETCALPSAWTSPASSIALPWSPVSR